jgi:DNA polymerase I-like protein with 3'-5' exonuclease and polymerase domains
MQELLTKLPWFLREQDPTVYERYKHEAIALDFETTNLDKGSPRNKENRILCSGIADARLRSSVERGGIYDLVRTTRQVRKAPFIIAHNAKFELGWLARCGVPLGETLVWDTQIAEYVLRGNQSGGLGLDRCLARRGIPSKGQLVTTLIHAGVCPSQIPWSLLKRYQEIDAVVTMRLFWEQLREAQERGMVGMIYTKCLLTPILVDFEDKGMVADRDRVVQIRQKLITEHRETTKNFFNEFGEINFNSPLQKRELIYGELKFPTPKDFKGQPLLTDSGQLPTSADVLVKLHATTKRQKLCLKYLQRMSSLNSMLSKTIEKLYEQTDKSGEDIRIQAQYNQTLTATQRLSSSGWGEAKLQLHNVDRRFKPLFKSRNEGWKISEDDQSGLEFRIAIHHGKDEQGLLDIQSGHDPHAFTASTLFTKWKEELTDGERSALRTKAKADTFKPLFGGTSGTKAQRAYYDSFKQRYPGIARAQENWISEALEKKSVTLETGATFYFPDVRVTSTGYVMQQTNIKNYPVQYFATGEIVPIGVIYQWHLMKAAEMESFLVNTVHDSTIGEVHPEEEERYNAIASYAHTEMVYNYLKKVYKIELFVPLEVESKVRDFWNDSEEWKEEWLH